MIGFPSIGTSRTVTDASHEGASGVASKSRPNVHAPGDPYHTLHDDSQGVGPLGPEIVVEPPKHEAKLANRRWRTSTATVPWTVDGAPTKVAPGAEVGGREADRSSSDGLNDGGGRGSDE